MSVRCLSPAVKVAGDGAGADVRPGPDAGVAQVAEVAGQNATSQVAFFYFDEVAEMHAGFQISAGAQVAEGSNVNARLPG